ncbi:hypothetical protein A3A67_05735 [Candidatus Peribacteria bacterium RIFCSPLOWO2_01_FULL_51_18]|nr:MAG: hypothetical protein A3A67_05735 [Candidatus Peribacteria bacterium RIFCSPLOWO2_01_FULL_51_18]
MLEPMIVFSSVSKEYNGNAVLDNISFSIRPGEFVCITGPSGAGKSTLIHLMIRAEMPTSGSIEVDGADITKLPIPVLQVYRRRMGVVFQDYKLLTDRTVGENVAFALEVKGATDDEIKEKVTRVLAELKLVDQIDSFPNELSGGEKTRTSLARALVHDPTILIADEPTGNIDPRQSMEIIDLLKKINQKGTTVILASHDRLVVDAACSRVLRLEDGKLVGDWVGGYMGGEKAANVSEKGDSSGQPAETGNHPAHAHPVHHHAAHAHTHPHHPAHAHGSEEHHKVKPISI